MTRLTFEDDAATIADRQQDVRYALRRQHESVNEAVAAAFADYLAAYPVADAAERENVRALFEAYAADAGIRQIIDNRNYGALAGTALSLRQYRAVASEHRERIPGYVRARLLSGPQAA